MGSPKHALRVADGRTMLEAVADAMAGVCSRVVVVGDAETALIHDLRPGCGPLGGIEALLASNLDTEYLVCPCDLPLVTPALLERLTVETGQPATVFKVEGEPDFWPLPARLSAVALTTVRDHLDHGQRAVHECVRALAPLTVTVTKPDAHLLANVNTPEDYQALAPPPPND